MGELKLMSSAERAQKDKELTQREQYLNLQQNQLAQLQSQLDSAFLGIVRNSYLQNFNWAVDLMLKDVENGSAAWSVGQLISQANLYYEAVENRISEIAETRKSEALARIKEANEKAEAERLENENKKAE